MKKTWIWITVGIILALVIGSIYYFQTKTREPIVYDAPGSLLNAEMVSCTYRTNADKNDPSGYDSDVATFWEVKVIDGFVKTGDVITMIFPGEEMIRTSGSVINSEGNFGVGHIVNENIQWSSGQIGDEIYFYGVGPYESVYYELVHHSKDCQIGRYDICNYNVIKSGTLRLQECDHW